MEVSSATAVHHQRATAVHKPPARGKSRVPWLYALHPAPDTRVAFAIPATDVHERRHAVETPHDHRKRAEHQHQPSLPVLCPTSLPATDASHASACPCASDGGGDVIPDGPAAESMPCMLMHADLARAKQNRIHTAADSPPPPPPLSVTAPAASTTDATAPLSGDDTSATADGSSSAEPAASPQELLSSAAAAAEDPVRVYLPNDVAGTGASEPLLPSMCLPTKSLSLDDDGHRRVGPEPLTHCAHWLNRRMCVYGPSCRFVHCVSGTTLQYPPPSVNGAASSGDDADDTCHGGARNSSPLRAAALPPIVVDTSVRVGVRPPSDARAPRGAAHEAPAAVEAQNGSGVRAVQQPALLPRHHHRPDLAVPSSSPTTQGAPPAPRHASGVLFSPPPMAPPPTPALPAHFPHYHHFAANPAAAAFTAPTSLPLVQHAPYHQPHQHAFHHVAPPHPWTPHHGGPTSGLPAPSMHPPHGGVSYGGYVGHFGWPPPPPSPPVLHPPTMAFPPAQLLHQPPSHPGA